MVGIAMILADLLNSYEYHNNIAVYLNLLFIRLRTDMIFNLKKMTLY